MTSENKKKAITSLLVVVITLVGLVISATYAYYGADTSNSFGTKSITAEAESAGSVALNGTNATLMLNLATRDMRKDTNDITYWGVTSGDPVTTQNVVTIGSTSVTGGKTYNCSYSGSVTASGTNNMYTAFQSMTGKSANQIVLKIGENTYDFNTANLFPISISGTLNGISSSNVANITAEFYLVNKASIDQTDLAGTDISINVSISDFSCTVVYSRDYTNYLAGSSYGSSALLRGQSIQKYQIESIEFLNTTNVPTDGTTNVYDVSYHSNHKIVASIVAGQTSGKYKIYVGENGGVIANPISNNLFRDFTYLTSIVGLENFDTSLVTDMDSMFTGCERLTYLDLSSFDTSGVTRMEGTFNSCRSLTYLDISSFDTSSVTDMTSMFAGCSSLTSLNLSSFDTSNVLSMWGLFSDMSSLNSITFGSDWDTSSVTNMAHMFYNTGLSSLDLSSFNTTSATNMSEMFGRNTSLASLNLSSFNTSNVIDMTGMFEGMSGLTSINFGSNFNTSNVRFMGYDENGYYDSILGETVYASSGYGMFEDCSSLTSLNLSGFNTSNVLSMWGMFSGMSSLNSINFGSNFVTSSVTNMGNMFASVGLTSLDLSHFNTSNVTYMADMFIYSNIDTLNLSSFNTSNVTNMESMFHGMEHLITLDISSFNTSNVAYMSYMFSEAYNLTTIYVSSNFVTSALEDPTELIFNGCSHLVGGNGTHSTWEHEDSLYARIDAPGTPGYFTLAS